MNLFVAILLAAPGAEPTAVEGGVRSLEAVQLEAVAAHVRRDHAAVAELRAELDSWGRPDELLTARANAVILSELIEDEPGYIERFVWLCQHPVADLDEAQRRHALIESLFRPAREGEALKRSIRAAEAAAREWRDFVEDSAIVVLKRALRGKTSYSAKRQLVQAIRHAAAATSDRTAEIETAWREQIEDALEELDWIEAQCHYDALEYRPLWNLTRQHLARYGAEGRFARKMLEAAERVTAVRTERGLDMIAGAVPDAQWLAQWRQKLDEFDAARAAPSPGESEPPLAVGDAAFAPTVDLRDGAREDFSRVESAFRHQAEQPAVEGTSEGAWTVESGRRRFSAPWNIAVVAVLCGAAWFTARRYRSAKR